MGYFELVWFRGRHRERGQIQDGWASATLFAPGIRKAKFTGQFEEINLCKKYNAKIIYSLAFEIHNFFLESCLALNRNPRHEMAAA